MKKSMIPSMSKIKTIMQTYQSKGLYGVKCLVKDKFFPIKERALVNIDLYHKYFINKSGIEIGGPSSLFSEEAPIYDIIYNLDGCNYSTQTVWEGNIVEGENFNYFGNKMGYQYICEASNLEAVPNEKYDFLLACHCLEHCANTLKTVKEWVRVIKKGGAILLVLPDRKYTFDHNRSITTFEHLVDDFKNDTEEKDLTHYKEILELHDLNRDPAAGTKKQFEERSLDNHKNRCLHHHVFDFELLKKIYRHYDIKIIDMTFIKPNHQIILGVKQ